MRLPCSLPYNSQARGVIERVHQSIFIRMAREMDSYIGKDMGREAAQQHHKLTRTGTGTDPGGSCTPAIPGSRNKNGVVRLPMSWTDFLAALEGVIDRYNRRPHTSLPTFVDANTGKRRHYSPSEYRAHKMATLVGFKLETVKPEEAEILFRPRTIRKISRGEINLVGNRYFAKNLDAHHGEDLQIAYDIHDPQFIWVYDEDGRFIGKAELNGNAKAYFPQSVVDMARDKRADGRLNRLQAHIDEIELERKGGLALNVQPIAERPGMRAVLRKQEKQPVAIAATIPSADQLRERYELWRDLDNTAQAGGDIPDHLRHFYNAYPTSAQGKSWISLYADAEAQRGAQ